MLNSIVSLNRSLRITGILEIAKPQATSIIVAGSHSIFEGPQPIIFNMIDHLPEGSKAVASTRRREDIVRMTMGLDLSCYPYSERDGTGAGVLAAQDFIRRSLATDVIITSGDRPLAGPDTYHRMLARLNIFDMVVSGFEPPCDRGYGMLEIEDGKVYRHTDKHHWNDNNILSPGTLAVCNAGIYAVKKNLLLQYMAVLASRPRIINKAISGIWKTFERYDLNDLIRFMVSDGRSIGCLIVGDKQEAIRINDLNTRYKSPNSANQPFDANGTGGFLSPVVFSR